MKLRPDLIAWQYRGYSANHKNKINIAIHIATVPLFCSSWILFGASAFFGSMTFVFTGLIFLVTPLIAQGIGHKLEEKSPDPFLGPLDFISRLFVEQFITFPRWIICRILKKD